MMETLAAIAEEIVQCRKCPRLVEWRERVAREKRAAFSDWTYWGKPVPGFGDPAARLLVVGLAPAAHGANRTGRVFTGDRSGDWLFRAMYRAGFANQPTSERADDGLELHDAFVAAAVRCAPPANKPTPQERDNCAPFLVRESRALTRVTTVLCLGAFGYASAAKLYQLRPRPAFGHGVEAEVGGRTIICSYHPSQQNTFTGKLTEEMFDAVFQRCRELVEATP